MPYKYCQHVKENGIFCGSPALRGRKYCYYHLRSRARKLVVAQAAAKNKAAPLDLPPLEDMHAVQVAIQNVLEALSAGALERHTAGLMLYGLQQASSNLRNPVWMVSSHFERRGDEDNLIVSYPCLESEFGLPEDVDLDARPDETFQRPLPSADRITLTWPDTQTWLDSMKSVLEKRHRTPDGATGTFDSTYSGTTTARDWWREPGALDARPLPAGDLTFASPMPDGNSAIVASNAATAISPPETAPASTVEEEVEQGAAPTPRKPPRGTTTKKLKEGKKKKLSKAG